MPASQNRLTLPASVNGFTEMVVLKQPPPKIVYFPGRSSKDTRPRESIFGERHIIRSASKKAEAQARPDSRL